MSAREKASRHVNSDFDPNAPLDPSRALTPAVARRTSQVAAITPTVTNT